MIAQTNSAVEQRCGDELSPYFLQLRPEIVGCIPTSARQVLSVGCGAGLTEAELVKRGVRVVGIELNPEAAETARGHGIEVIEGDATAPHPELQGQAFDCIVYADVLEHLPDPLAVLRLHVPLLAAGGTVVVSIPNFRHVSVLWQLVVRGHIRYEDAGIFDRTHLRLTTRRMVEGWFADVGLRRTNVEYLSAQRREVLGVKCSFGLLSEFLARQVIVIGQKPG